ncbi:MAG: sugar ABC transporter permease [Sphaerochaeta sp.]|nr:sugar ABC transporter permease [Sphaerochaeta sp.]
MGWLLLLPAMAIFALMIFYPFINSIFISFTNRNLLYAKSAFIGFDNYRKLFSDPNTLFLIWTTVKFVFLATLMPFAIGLIWALLMNQKFKGSEFVRGLTLVNWIIPGIAIGFLWSWIFNGDYGILNALLGKLGLIDKNVIWFGGKQTSMLAVVIARTWQMFPWYMAFIMGGLQGVSNDQCEAARIDGVNNLQMFRHVIIPAIKPVLILILLLGTIGNLQHFDLINVMTGGGPERATSTFATEVYKKAFKEYSVGRAASLGVIWAMMLSLFSIFYLKRIKED